MAILGISGLCVRFRTQSGIIHAVDSVDFTMEPGDSCALVGESGCGKSVLGMAVMRLLPSNADLEGSIRFRNCDLAEAGEHAMQQMRGTEIAMIPQNSATALNPVMTIGRQVAETLQLHEHVSHEAAASATKDLLMRLGFRDPCRAMASYPHEVSGGMRERILIAMALVCNPDLIIADEPTAGLDLLIRNQTIDLLKEHSLGKTLLLITHDLGTAHHLCSRISVMYAGEIVETGPTREVLAFPGHPYTLGLLMSFPSAGLHPIPGMSPSPGGFPQGCRFFARCPSATDMCQTIHPRLLDIGDSRQVRCHYYD